MKKLVFSVFILLSSIGRSQTVASIIPAEILNEATHSSLEIAIVYFISLPEDKDNTHWYSISIDGSRVADLKNKGYSMHTVPAGLHQVNCQKVTRRIEGGIHSNDELNPGSYFDFKPGGTYFLKVNHNLDMMLGNEVELLETTDPRMKRMIERIHKKSFQ